MRTQKQRSYSRLRLALGLLFVMFVAGCVSSPERISQASQIPSTQPAGCSDKDCFISAANDCQDISVTLNEDIGVFKYASSKDCVFTKTLVSPDEDETPEIKKLLSGKSLMCTYKKGEFDGQWVTSLVFGTEYCEGELKDILGKLILFA